MTKTNEIKTTATLINELNAIRTTAKATEINKKIAEINEQLKADSVASRDARINELLAMERNSLFVEFINNPSDLLCACHFIPHDYNQQPFIRRTKFTSSRSSSHYRSG